MSTSSNSYLLDTHVVLWSLYEPHRLSSLADAVLKDSASILHFSEANLWELLDKASKGRLPLAGTSAKQIAERIFNLDVVLLSVTQEDILQSVSLPLHHGDPFDRMLIAQAQRQKLTIISRDQMLLLYDVPVIW